MRKLEHKQIPNDPASLIGYNEQNELINTVTQEEWEYARRILTGKPSGTKLAGTENGEPITYFRTRIEYTYDNYDSEGVPIPENPTEIRITFSLSYSYERYHGKIYCCDPHGQYLEIDDDDIALPPEEKQWVKKYFIENPSSRKLPC